MGYAAFVTSATLSLGLAFSAYAQQDLPIRPNDAVTPGVVETTDVNDVCGVVNGLTFSKRHRATTSAMKQAAFDAYGIPRVSGNSFEVDHRVPLCIGGADDERNLWPQEGTFHPNYHDKDRLEDRVCLMVCRDHTMTLEQGQAIFMGDWIAAYLQVFGQPVPQ